MKTKIRVEKEVDIKYVELNVAVRYDEEDMPNDFPFRKGDMWNVTVEIDTGQILNWPKGVSLGFYMKVCDQGSYYLKDDNFKTVAKIENDYVPNGVIPGEYGDYIEMQINENGVIENWPKEDEVDFGEFFGDDYD